MNEVEIAWAAGLFEGEGWIGLVKTNGRSYPMLAVNMTDEDVLIHFHTLVGGRLNGPYKVRGHKDQWRWSAFGLTAREILNLFSPFLGVRRKEKMNEVLQLSDVPTRSYYRRSERQKEE